jgi:hypothetical protein
VEPLCLYKLQEEILLYLAWKRQNNTETDLLPDSMANHFCAAISRFDDFTFKINFKMRKIGVRVVSL